jgi:hypothetical protein
MHRQRQAVLALRQIVMLIAMQRVGFNIIYAPFIAV